MASLESRSVPSFWLGGAYASGFRRLGGARDLYAGGRSWTGKRLEVSTAFGGQFVSPFQISPGGPRHNIIVLFKSIGGPDHF